jgi:hypothetical protein
MTCFSELSLTDMLDDPLIGSLMAADSVDRDELEAMLSTMAQAVDRTRSRKVRNLNQAAPG